MTATGGIENVVEIASASSGKVSDDIKSSASTKSSSRLSGLLNFFKYPIFLLLAVLIVVVYLKNRAFKKRTREENLEDFENLDDEKHMPGN